MMVSLTVSKELFGYVLDESRLKKMKGICLNFYYKKNKGQHAKRERKTWKKSKLVNFGENAFSH
jgi:hypothetical protein